MLAKGLPDTIRVPKITGFSAHRADNERSETNDFPKQFLRLDFHTARHKGDFTTERLRHRNEECLLRCDRVLVRPDALSEFLIKVAHCSVHVASLKGKLLRFLGFLRYQLPSRLIKLCLADGFLKAKLKEPFKLPLDRAHTTFDLARGRRQCRQIPFYHPGHIGPCDLHKPPRQGDALH